MNFKQAKCQLFKGTLFTAGLGLGIGAIYTLAKVYNKGEELYEAHRDEQRFEEYIQTDSRFANGLTLTKFCIDVHNNYKK